MPMTDEQLIEAVKARKDAASKANIDKANAAITNPGGYTLGDLPQVAQTADDVVRQLAGPAGDTLAAVAQNPVASAATLATGGAALPAMLNQPDVSDAALIEAVKTRKAAERLNTKQPGSAEVVGAVGDVGKILALPGSAFATPLRAMVTGATINSADTMFGKMDKGEPINTDAEEYIINALKGAGSGFLGYHAGKLIGNTLSSLVGKDPSIAKEAEAALAVNKKIADEANAKVLNSGVQINTMGQNKLLHNLEKSLGKRYELSRGVTPSAWRAMNVLRNRVAQGADISLDNFIALRDAVGKSLYSPSGLLARDVSGRDLQIVDDIYKGMNKFISDLPITRQFVRSGGDLKSGMQGYQNWSKFKQVQDRSENIVGLILNASAKAASAGAKRKSIEQALQEEFGSMFTGKEARAAAERMFTPEQLVVMEKIANGDLSQKIFSTLDKWVGGSLIAPIFRGIRSLHGAAFQAEESRNLARKVISAVGETPQAKRIGSKLGVATVVEALKGH